MVADSYPQVDISLSIFTQLSEYLGLRLDVDTSPAKLVERLGYGIEHRITGANINIESVHNAHQGAMQHDVFKVLRVGNERHEPGVSTVNGCIFASEKSTRPTFFIGLTLARFWYTRK